MKTLGDNEAKVLVSALEDYIRILGEQDRPHKIESMILRKLKSKDQSCPFCGKVLTDMGGYGNYVCKCGAVCQEGDWTN